MVSLLDRAIAAHGGWALWQTVTAIDVRLSVAGDIWQLKGQAALFERVSARVLTNAQRIELSFDTAPYRTSDWTPEKTVLHMDDGEVLERVHPRHHFDGQFVASVWDELDAVYFLSYALWTYFTLPFSLKATGVTVREIGPWRELEDTWERLHITYPETFATHGRHAVAYFDASGLLRRYDYAVDIMGGAPRANYAHGYADCSGLTVAQHRQVFPYDERGAVRDPLVVDLQVLGTSAIFAADNTG